MKFLALLLSVASMAVAAGSARAADLTITVRDGGGKPVPDAVVMAYVGGQPSKAPIRFDWPYRVAQQNIQFTPFVLIVPAGAEVAFPNLDKVRHHVYSFSAGNRFELKLYGREENRVVRLPAVGVAAIGCNIHDQMVGWIVIVDTPYFGRSGEKGQVVLDKLPAGNYRLRSWHAGLPVGAPALDQAVSVPAEGQLAVTLRMAGVRP